MHQEWVDLTDPQTRFADLTLRFQVEDGEQAGQLTHGYGGLWDRDLSPWDGYKTTWDRARQLYVPIESGVDEYAHNPLLSRVSEQALPLVSDIWTRTLFVLGGRRSGKSYGAAQRAGILALRFPGVQGLVLSPTYRQARNVYRHILRVVPRDWLLPGKLGAKWSNENREVVFVNGASIVFRTADNAEGCRSDGAGWLLVDEWQDISDDAYDNAHSSLSEAGDDYLITITATIKPELRPRYDRLRELEQGSIGMSKIIRMRSRGNPFIGHAMFDEAALFMDASRVEQEHEAQWPELVGRIYWSFDADQHVRSFPVHGRSDATATVLHDRFGGPPPYTDNARTWFISVDPPHHAALWKFYEDDSMHLVHEVLVGADGAGGDIRTLVDRCTAITGGRAVVVIDPHDNRYDSDLRKYFAKAGFQVVSIRGKRGGVLPVEYRITAMRAQMERGRVLVDPGCPHAIEVLNLHQYKDGHPGQPSKTQTYTTSHQKHSKKIQLVHLADTLGYGVYKIHPALYDYEHNERSLAA